MYDFIFVRICVPLLFVFVGQVSVSAQNENETTSSTLVFPGGDKHAKEVALDHDEPFNLSPIPDLCPAPSELLSNLSNSDPISGGHGETINQVCSTLKDDEFSGEVQLSRCSADTECQLGSKCCNVVAGCSFKWCIDLKDGRISERLKWVKKNNKAITVRRRRQSFGCVSCSCIRYCQSSRDCQKNTRRKRCFRNVCSSYCTI